VRESRGSLSMVGMHGGEWFGTAAGEAVRHATVVLGDPRHVGAIPPGVTARRENLGAPLSDGLERAGALMDAGEQVCIVVSGDPGFFGLARVAAARFGEALRVYPAPSSVSLAFARAGTNWDDAVVVSAHGRDSAGVDRAVQAVVRHPKVAVMTAPADPPQRLGRALVDAGCGHRRVLVASRLAEEQESVWEGDLAGLAEGRFDGLSVVVFVAPSQHAEGGEPTLEWGLPEECFEHRAGMITKSEVRAVALGKLALPRAGVLWDVGAGSGSVSAECCRLAPGLRVFAVERDSEDAERARRNLDGMPATVVEGEAPAALGSLPDPDRVFVGGGGEAVLDDVIARLRPGGTVVATYAVLERAVQAAGRLGNLVQLSVSRGVPAGEGGPLRLQAENPVFVCWGSP
jgi:precorrin-6Y C5,15-methyltransferase (decarboxylating)